MATGSDRARVALVVPNLEFGGGVPAVARFIHRAIRKEGRYDVSIISLPMSSRDPSSVLVRDPATWTRGIASRTGYIDGEPFVEVGAFISEIEIMRYQRRAALTVAVADCDLIQIVAGTPAWANAILGLGKPVVLQVATLIDVERRKLLGQSRSLPRAWWWAMTRLVARLDAASLKRVDAVLVENPWMAAHALRISREGRPFVRYAPPGVDIKLFRPAEHGEASPIDQPYILCVGRFSDPRKNIGLLIEAYSRLTSRGRPLLVLAGKDLPEAIIRRHVASLGLTGDVRLIPDPLIDELARLYRHAKCFALPSDEEGFGMVVIEAMASGIPVVATRCGGPDGIITDGEDGFLVVRDDVDGMARQLALLSRDSGLAAEIGRRARITVEDTYSEEVAGRAFLETYDMLLGQRAAKAV